MRVYARACDVPNEPWGHIGLVFLSFRLLDVRIITYFSLGLLITCHRPVGRE